MRVRLFGGFRFETAEGAILSFRSKKAEAALLALALESPSPVARDKLIDLLWADASDDRGRATLRQTLSRIRTACRADPFLTPAAGWIAIDRRRVWCDLWALKDAAAGLGPAPQVKGDLLEFAPRPTDRFDEWLLGREHEVRAETSALLLAALKDAGHDFDPWLAEALLHIDPFHEETVIRVESHYRERGDAHAANRIRETYLARLDAECGAQDARASAERLRDRFGRGEASQPMARPARMQDDPPTISVSPLRQYSGDAAEAYFGRAFAEELIVGLSQQRWFRVCAVDMPGDYKPPGVVVGPHEGPRAYRLGGSYALNETTLRLRLTLTRAEDGDVVWAGRFDEPRDVLFDIGADVVRQVTATASSEVMSAETVLAVKDGRAESDLDDWTRIMKARHLFWRTSRQNNAAARALLDPCLATSPDSIPALTTAAFVRLLDVWSFWSQTPDKDLLKAIDLSQRAVRVAPRDPWAHFTLGTALGANRRLRDGVDSMNRALALQPSLVAALGERGRLHLFLGDLDAAAKDTLAAVELNGADPHLGLWLNTLGLIAFFREDFDAAVDWTRRAVAANPYWFHHFLLAAAIRCAMGDLEKARKHVATARKQAPNLNLTDFGRSHPFKSADLQDRYFDPLRALGL